ncbi:MAG: hypothetical protein R3F61_15005 [Myxococcota bacterium]
MKPARIPAVLLALALGSACETPVPTGGVGCQLELATRADIVEDTVVVDVWVTVFGEDRVLSIPNCVGTTLNSVAVVPCDDQGQPDPSGCQPATFELRRDTSVQVARIERPLGGDACNEPLEPGLYDVAAFGVETADLEVCRLYDILVVP